MNNCAFRVSENLTLVMHNQHPPSDAEWHIYIESILAAAFNCGGDLGKTRQLVFTDGGGPNAAQRTAALDAIETYHTKGEARVAVISQSALVRGIVAVFNCFDLNVRTFPPPKLDRAFSFLGLTERQIEWVWRTVDELAPTIVGGVVTSTKGRHLLRTRGTRLAP